MCLQSSSFYHSGPSNYRILEFAHEHKRQYPISPDPPTMMVSDGWRSPAAPIRDAQTVIRSTNHRATRQSTRVHFELHPVATWMGANRMTCGRRSPMPRYKRSAILSLSLPLLKAVAIFLPHLRFFWGFFFLLSKFGSILKKKGTWQVLCTTESFGIRVFFLFNLNGLCFPFFSRTCRNFGCFLRIRPVVFYGV